MNAWAPGEQSTVYPERAGRACCSPAIRACRRASRRRLQGVHAARGPGLGSLRRYQNHRSGRATAFSTMVSPTAPEVPCRPPSARCRGPRRISCRVPGSISPIPTAAPLRRSAPGILCAPATVLTVQSGMRAALLAELESLHRAGDRQGLSARRSLRRQQRHSSAAFHRS